MEHLRGKKKKNLQPELSSWKRGLMGRREDSTNTKK
uniref:Uncharacterized protein n=1 Tax=Anguilla anguilla TaxID=7936 RepID=A0A0E9W5E7_ANGAN